MSDHDDRLDDPKLRFYLERRAAIDEWAKLRELESVAACHFLRSLTTDAVTWADELGPDIAADSFMLDGEELVALWRRSWLEAEASDAERSGPSVMVAIGWSPKSVRFEGANVVPYAGLVVRRSERPELRALVGRLVHDRGAGKTAFPTGNPLKSSAWVRYRWLPCTTPDYWDDLRPYRSSLLSALSSAWSQFAEVVDDAVDNWRSDGTTVR